jgi:hypothetical protein
LDIEHFPCSAAGVDLVIMGEIGESFEDAKQFLVAGPRRIFTLMIVDAGNRAPRRFPWIDNRDNVVSERPCADESHLPPKERCALVAQRRRRLICRGPGRPPGNMFQNWH